MHRRRGALACCLAGVVIGLAAGFSVDPSSGTGETAVAGAAGTSPESRPQPAPDVAREPAPVQTTPPPPPPFAGWVDPASVGQPYGDVVQGLLTFRGNPTRTFYGSGPMPTAPEVDWSYPSGGALCGLSTVGSETTQWCGTGWTGQPAVFERDGRTWLVVGAYDHQVHFLDAHTGETLLPPFRTGDLVKGSVTVDPDGFGLVYVGSRDARYRVIAIDGDAPRELWSLHASDAQPTLWNNDWDGAGLVLHDHLIVGGENSRLHVVHLRRGTDANGLVTVDPELVFDAAGWDDELLAALGDHNVSIEGSVAVHGDTVYFANSGGLVQGWDLSTLRDGGEPQRVFRYWTGDDTDATVVVDEVGMLYVAVEWERFNARAAEVGQVLKLDPSRAGDPLVWSVDDQGPGVAGVWATPALHRDVLYVPTDGGRLLALDRDDGELLWEKRLARPWSSPVVVDDVLVQGDCDGVLRGYDVADTRSEPDEVWAVALTGCIESTPAVWGGRIYVGTRAGQVHAIADP